MQSIHKLGSSFWYMTTVSETDRPILGMVVGKEKTLMIDAGNSKAHARLFLEMLEEHHVSGPDMVALTHWHWDHIFGLSALKNTVSISSIETKQAMEKLMDLPWTDEALDERVREGTEIEFCASCIKEEYKEHRDIEITLPTLVFEGEIEMDLGGVTCVLKHVGGDHAADSVVVYIKEEKILFLGDCIYADIFAPKRNYTIQGIRDLAARLENYDAETYILSHWKPITRDEFNREIQLLKTVANFTEMCNGDAAKIKLELLTELKRELNEVELETIEYFVNGYGI